ncbi:hypothetical protein ACP275_08G039100 [Erythranthe tilingii]
MTSIFILPLPNDSGAATSLASHKKSPPPSADTPPSPSAPPPESESESSPPPDPSEPLPSTPSAPPPDQSSPPPPPPSAPPPDTPSPPPPSETSPPPPRRTSESPPPPFSPTAPPPSPTKSPPPPPSPTKSPPPPSDSPPPPSPSPPPPSSDPSPPPPPADSPPPAPPPPETPPPPPIASPPIPPPSPPPPIASPLIPPPSPPPPIASPPLPPPPIATPPLPPPPIATPPLPPPPIASPPIPPPPTATPSTSPYPPPPPNNTSTNGTLPNSPLPSEKPVAKSSQFGPNITADSTPPNPDGLKAGGAAAVGSIVGFFALSLVILAVWFTHKKKRRKSGFTLNYTTPSPFASSQNSDSSFLRRSQFSSQLAGSPSSNNNNYMYSQDMGLGQSRSWFTYQELSLATEDFSEKNILGEGGFGCVYKGILKEGRIVAVKQLKVGGGQGEREFRAEVEIISRIHHRHLVSLVGYCIAESQRLLVYDYAPNNTLHHHLHSEGNVMDWASRVKVAAGAARGLAYLHEDCQPRIIHRDIKSTNILLDNNFEALVADFGLAKLVELDLHTHVSTRVMGTFGYLSPEYASTGKLTEKSDVFSFGVVLLELITGRKPVDSSRPLGDESLVEWARPLLTQALEREQFGEIVDHRLKDNFVPSEMFRMIEAAAACVRHHATKRPKMSQVVRALDSMDELADLNNGVKPGQSGVFSSSEHSAQIRMFQRMAFGSQDYSTDTFNSQSSNW